METRGAQFGIDVLCKGIDGVVQLMS
jgi:hypothetical protein